MSADIHRKYIKGLMLGTSMQRPVLVAGKREERRKGRLECNLSPNRSLSPPSLCLVFVIEKY
jgi:hypothetical protein